MEIVSIVGARPQFVKLAPVSRALSDLESVNHKVIHTGQHYDDDMSAVFFEQLELPKPDLDLNVGSGSHGAQTAVMLKRLEESFLESRPDAVLVYGDTNSTLAATLAATKLHLPVAHVEAGLRSHNRAMPEEINRLVADHCSDRLYAPTSAAWRNLETENLAERSIRSGDVMRDAVNHNISLASSKSTVLQDMQLRKGEFALMTIHRPVNTTPDAFEPIMDTVSQLAERHLPIVFPVHPRTRPLVEGLTVDISKRILITEPMPYLDMLQLLEAASVALTDSGGVQKEAAFVETPCITLRDETEWTETVDMKINQLVGSDPDRITDAFERVISQPAGFSAATLRDLDAEYGAGDAAQLIAGDLNGWLGRFS